MDATQLQQLADRAEITELVSRLGIVLDEGRFDEMGALVTDDATVRTPGGAAEGREALVAQARRNHRVEQPIQHLIANLVVDFADDGDRASARANLVVHFGPLDWQPESEGTIELPPLVFTLGEVYRFELVRTDEGWRLQHIRTVPVWSAGARELAVPA
jgi:hypothetical protein